MPGEFFVGLDLGQTRDYTALVVVERVDFVPPVPPPHTTPRPRGATIAGTHASIRNSAAKPAKHYHVRLCDRPRLGTPYPEVVRRVRAVVDAIDGSIDLVVDATGVGRPVIDLLEAARMYPIAVTLTGGDVASQTERAFRVPKRDLVSTIEVLLQEGRLRIARAMKESSALVDELLGFRASVRSSGHDTYAAEGAGHDDLVIALALACWRGRTTERQPVGTPIGGVSEPWEDRDDADALWLGDPQLRYQSGYGATGGGGRFIGGGCAGIRAPRWMRFR